MARRLSVINASLWRFVLESRYKPVANDPPEKTEPRNIRYRGYPVAPEIYFHSAVYPWRWAKRWKKFTKIKNQKKKKKPSSTENNEIKIREINQRYETDEKKPAEHYQHLAKSDELESRREN